jgi:hypothetical protein
MISADSMNRPRPDGFLVRRVRGFAPGASFRLHADCMSWRLRCRRSTRIR